MECHVQVNVSCLTILPEHIPTKAQAEEGDAVQHAAAVATLAIRGHDSCEY